MNYRGMGILPHCGALDASELSMQRRVNNVASAMLPPHSSIEASPSSAGARCHNEASFCVHTEQTGLL